MLWEQLGHAEWAFCDILGSLSPSNEALDAAQRHAWRWGLMQDLGRQGYKFPDEWDPSSEKISRKVTESRLNPRIASWATALCSQHQMVPSGSDPALHPPPLDHNPALWNLARLLITLGHYRVAKDITTRIQATDSQLDEGQLETRQEALRLFRESRSESYR